MQRRCARDYAAAAVAIVMTLGIVFLRFHGETPPPELATAYGAAAAWLFVSATHADTKDEERNDNP